MFNFKNQLSTIFLKVKNGSQRSEQLRNTFPTLEKRLWTTQEGMQSIRKFKKTMNNLLKEKMDREEKRKGSSKLEDANR